MAAYYGFLKVKKMTLRNALPGTERRAVCRSSPPFNKQKLASGDCFGRESATLARVPPEGHRDDVRAVQAMTSLFCQ